MLVAQSCLTLCNPMECVACQAPLSKGFSRQDYWSGLPFPSPTYTQMYIIKCTHNYICKYITYIL